jgi:hypothetical protein
MVGTRNFWPTVFSENTLFVMARVRILVRLDRRGEMSTDGEARSGRYDVDARRRLPPPARRLQS